jgi:PAS domain S-box-containing protein
VKPAASISALPPGQAMMENHTETIGNKPASSDEALSEERSHALHLKLEQQARVFDTTLSSITDFAYTFDRDGRFTYVNQALLNLWGLKLEDAVGKNFFELKYPDELAAKLQRQIQQVIDTRERVKDETPYTSPTGAGGYYEYIFSPVFDQHGGVEVVAGSTRDITERKRVEQLLRESEEKYRSLVDALESQVRRRTAELELRNTEVLNQAKQVRDLARRLLKAQDDERRHIARELHDTAGQTLVVLCMNLARLIDQAKETDPDLANELQETEKMVQGLSKEIRTASYLLHPPLLDESGLPAALRWYVSGLAERSDLDIKLSIPEDFERLPDDLAVVVFRLVQECMTNVHRHSGSKSAAIRIMQNRESVSVEIEDRGHGISAERLAQIQLQGSGVGIQGMRERVRQLQGDLSIDSSSAGTKITVVLPVSKP